MDSTSFVIVSIEGGFFSALALNLLMVSMKLVLDDSRMEISFRSSRSLRSRFAFGFRMSIVTVVIIPKLRLSIEKCLVSFFRFSGQ